MQIVSSLNKGMGEVMDRWRRRRGSRVGGVYGQRVVDEQRRRRRRLENKELKKGDEIRVFGVGLVKKKKRN